MPGNQLIAIAVTAIICTVIAVAIMGVFPSKNQFPVNGKTVILTGGSQGMGKAAAIQLASKGANVAIVARNVKKLEAVVEQMKNAALSSEQKFFYFSADLTDAEESVRILREVKSWNGGRPADIVWCIAGSAHPGFFIGTETSALKAGMDQNYWSAAYMAHAALQQWLSPTEEKGNGEGSEARHLVFTSSLVAFLSMVGYTPYAPAKAALRSLSDALVQELEVYNGARQNQTGKASPAADVRVHTVFPGTIYSPGYEEENRTKPAITKKLEEDDTGQTEEQVASSSIKALEKGEYLITTTFIGSLMRVAALGGSPRNNRFVDTVLSWLTSIVWLFVQADMSSKIFKWGRDNGVPE